MTGSRQRFPLGRRIHVCAVGLRGYVELTIPVPIEVLWHSMRGQDNWIDATLDSWETYVHSRKDWNPYG